MKIAETVRCYQEAFLRLIYPSHCGACRTLLPLEESGLCRICKENLNQLSLDLEASCLDLDFRFLRQAWALYPYESPVKEILGGIKFHSKRWLTEIFSEDLRRLAAALSEETYDWIVPIPLEKTRLVERQFNQSELFARILNKFLPSPIVCALKKRIWTPPQSRLHRDDRQTNLHYAFCSARSARGKKILLIDDVLTTGATAEEAARVLKESGASQIDLAVIACSRKDLDS